MSDLSMTDSSVQSMAANLVHSLKTNKLYLSLILRLSTMISHVAI